MPLPAEMLEASVRINSMGALRGTGFVVTVASERLPEARWGYVITANHVISNQGQLEVVAYDPTRGGAAYAPVSVQNWRRPLAQVDLAIAPFSVERLPIYAMKLEEHVVPTEEIEAPNLGARTYYVGVFTTLDRMMARSGTLGALNVPGVPGHGAPVHLLDCRSYDGFSGSPCFFEVAYGTDRSQTGPYPGPDPSFSFTTMAYFQLLCGMLVAHFSDDASAHGITSRYGVGVVVRSEEIQTALMTPQARAEHREWDLELERRGNHG